MKYNFGLLKNRNVGFKFTIDGKKYSLMSEVQNIIQNKESITFVLPEMKLEILQKSFRHTIIRKDEDVIYIEENNNKTILSGYVGFSLFDTYGFPVEVLEEILEEKGYKLDVEGFEVLKMLQKEKSQGTFKNVSAF